ncbi:MAG TPA: helix-turn-helix transcriptional regulator [Oscillospiraceae bacterium]|nr:helix-turn-helix transcriptional regulator [Oscillospiraceae bacterium]
MKNEILDLANRRKKLNLTQEQLAKKLGLAAGTVSMWEAGLRKPSIIMLKRIAKILNCTTDELLEPIKIENQKSSQNCNPR